MDLKETRKEINRVVPFSMNIWWQEPIRLWRNEAGAQSNVPRRLVYHSPDGYEWGYGGSGPADLALNICALFVPPYWAWRMHQEFKWEWVASLERDASHELDPLSVRAWIAEWYNKQEAE